MKNIPKPIKIKILYNEELKKITGKYFEESIISEGLSFVSLLYFIFSSYPEIKKRFPPGKLGLLLNNQKPNGYEILKEGDEIKLIGIK